MANFQPLSAETHNTIGVDESKLATTFSTFHLVNVEVKEAVQAASEFPLFFTKVANQQTWTISAVCGFAPQENVFELNGNWHAQYTPLSLRTLPFTTQLMEGNSEPTIHIDESSPSIVTNGGEALFLESLRPTAYLDNKKKLLSERIGAMQQSVALVNEINKLELIQAVDLIIEYADNTQQRIGGLATLNEMKLQNLSPEALESLNKQGLLSVVFNILGSIFQVNRVIRLHNNKFADRMVSNIKFETSKS